MGYQEKPHAEFPLNSINQFEDLRLDGNVQCGRRLVSDEKFRSAGKGHGDHDPLAHPAAQLMWIVIVPGRGRRYADAMKDLDGFQPCIACVQASVEAETFRNLVADPEDRIQRGHRFLEYHGYSVAPNTAHFIVGQEEQVSSLEEDFAGCDYSRRWNQSKDRKCRNAFAAAGFSDKRESLLFFKAKVQ
jgi:hypothetical protein